MIAAAEYCNHFYSNFKRDIYGAVRGSAVFKVTLREITYNSDDINKQYEYSVCIFYRDPTEDVGYGYTVDNYGTDYKEALAAYKEALRTYHFKEEDKSNA